MRRLYKHVRWAAKHGFINVVHRLSHPKLFDIEAKQEFRVSNSSITDSELLATYPSLCGLAARDSETFKKFRSSRVLVQALDHVSIEQGNLYISEILKLGPWSEKFTEVLFKIDLVGKPRKFKF